MPQTMPMSWPLILSLVLINFLLFISMKTKLFSFPSIVPKSLNYSLILKW